MTRLTRPPRLARHSIALLLCAAAALAATNFAPPCPAADPPHGDRVGGLTAAGDVWTNDALLPSGSSVHVGDEIRTGSRALGVVEGPALGRIEIREDSAMRLAGDSIVLRRGAVASDRTAVHVADARISPATSGDTWFVVRQDPGRTVVAVHSGRAVIESAGAPAVAVPAGMYALATDPAAPRGQAAPEAGDDDDDDPAAAAPPPAAGRGAAQAAKKSGWKLSSLAGAKGAVILTGVAAAAVTGAVAAGGTRDQAASPQD